MSRNITLTIDEDVLAAAKLVAAERRTSVNALVRDYLAQLVARRAAVDESREALLRLIRDTDGDLGTQRWNRDALYDR